MSKASEDALGELHGAVAVALTSIIKDGVAVLGGKGEDVEAVKIDAPASYFAAAIALLKNNNITADPSSNAALNGLKEQLAKSRQDRKGTINSKQQAADRLEQQLGGMTFHET
jgi:hypothetical protein